MKIRYGSLRIGKFLLGILVWLPFQSILAQSGRVIPPPRPTTPATETIRPEAKLIFTPDPNADKYKLVFALSSEGKRRYTSAEKEALNRALYSQRKNYVEMLNKEGALGYRLLSSISGVALVKQESVQYEYTWFLTTSGAFFAKQGFEAEYATRVKQGFSLIDHLFLSRSCEFSPPTPYNELPEIHTDRCEYNDFFILERVKGNEATQKYRLAQHIPRWRELNGEVTLTEQLNDDLAKAFYPTHAFSKYEILSQPRADQELPAGEKVELCVLIGDLQKKVNALAQQGYRLAVSNYEIAVMARRKGDTRPASYIWLDATKKDFAKRLAQVQEQGAVYLTTCPDQHGDEKHLIFEVPSVSNNTRREYKILKFEIQTTENIAEQKLYSDLTPVSKETLKTLNQLAREGFEARDLFISDEYIFSKNFRLNKISVLLERSR